MPPPRPLQRLKEYEKAWHYPAGVLPPVLPKWDGEVNGVPKDWAKWVPYVIQGDSRLIDDISLQVISVSGRATTVAYDTVAPPLPPGPNKIEVREPEKPRERSKCPAPARRK